MINKYEQISNLNIIPLEGVTTETLLDEWTVIILKHLENKTKLVKFFREQTGEYINTVVGK